MTKYNHKEIETKWRRRWKEENLYKTKEKKDKPKYYILDMFPYPSGSGLHVGHPKGYIATDIFARMKLLQGYNVLHPMGWDAFGLPAENYALKNKVHPRVAVEKNIATFKRQLEKLGFAYDWGREINTTDPGFYKWTQWVFLQMFKRGLANESYEPINWCPSCQTGLANEDLENGLCERCGSAVERKPMRQWVLKITDYADRLLYDLDKLPEWEESIKEMQKNWIGRSEGAVVKFPVFARSEVTKQSRIKADKHGIAPSSLEARNDNILEVFTTRPDTLFGCTYMVVAPEHPLIKNCESRIANYEEIKGYINNAAKKSDLERTELQKEKSGVKIEGLAAVNPVNSEEIPIYIADYVLMGYGTGAIMAVPAHDQRDHSFAKKYGIAIKQVVAVTDELIENAKIKNQNDNVKLKIDVANAAFEGEGISVNSGFLNELITKEAKEKMIKWLEERGAGKRAVNYKLKDWVFSRQRYWGEPIPTFHCEQCKNRKYNYILLHGREGNSLGGFLPWLKKELEALGHEAASPDLPDTDNPKVESQADFVLKNYKLNENTIIIGHSLGGAVALKILEKTSQEVQRVVLVDTPLRPEFNDGVRPDLERNFDWKFDFLKIKKMSEFVVLADRNFPIVPEPQSHEYGKELDARHLVFTDPEEVHFCSAVEPAVLKYSIPDGIYPVSENELPVLLPDVEHYEPTGTGESPLLNIKKWVEVICPRCGGPAKRETNTMPQWAGSSWYYLRFIDPKNGKAPVDKAKEKYWSPVDFYVGGAEHATRHLIYARFWHKFLYDIGAVNYGEPFTRLQHVGLILAEDGRKMSKRWNNVINPDDIVEKYGADAMRVYEMFMGPFSGACAWNTNGLIGARRFLEKIHQINFQFPISNFQINSKPEIKTQKLIRVLHKTIRKVGEDIENFKFNTAIAQMMIFINVLSDENKITRDMFEKFLIILSPFAPHLVEELWHVLGHKKSIFTEQWPSYDEALARDEIIEMVIQVNGKLRNTLNVSPEISEEEARRLALENEKIKKWISDKEIIKIIFVKGKLINIVVK